MKLRRPPSFDHLVVLCSVFLDDLHCFFKNSEESMHEKQLFQVALKTCLITIYVQIGTFLFVFSMFALFFVVFVLSLLIGHYQR